MAKTWRTYAFKTPTGNFLLGVATVPEKKFAELRKQGKATEITFISSKLTKPAAKKLEDELRRSEDPVAMISGLKKDVQRNRRRFLDWVNEMPVLRGVHQRRLMKKEQEYAKKKADQAKEEAARKAQDGDLPEADPKIEAAVQEAKRRKKNQEKANGIIAIKESGEVADVDLDDLVNPKNDQ